ncbi:MAG: hypothetical protein D6E12_15130 [Desulfovibrio sp.]|nr:MAG: hypothetical protein D6E12_15130 [Desulfovibrio sp.]
MKVLILGLGRVATELLKRLAESWRATLVDKGEDRLTEYSARFASVVRVVAGDASSPVVLEEAGLAEQDYVLALTDDDRVNLAACNFARDAGVKHILSLVNDPDQLDAFSELGVRTLSVATGPARSIYHYLQDPRIDVTPIGRGRGEIMEVEVSDNHWTDGKPAHLFGDAEWRLAAVFRGQDMLFAGPDTKLKSGDRLVFLGRPDMFQPVCSLLECSQPSFPLGHGQKLLAAFPHAGETEQPAMLDEVLHLAQNTRVKELLVLCNKDRCPLKEKLSTWSQSLDLETRVVSDNPLNDVREICDLESIGLAVIPLPQAKGISALTKATVASLAHDLPCPLLVTKQSHPYSRILVPFHGARIAEQALETAIDLAQQIGAEVTAVVVQEPEFLHDNAADATGTGDTIENWLDATLAKIRELAHIHKFTVNEAIRQGNPVREVVDLARDYNLIVLGSSSKDKGVFSPNLGDMIARKSPCSVLMVTG